MSAVKSVPIVVPLAVSGKKVVVVRSALASAADALCSITGAACNETVKCIQDIYNMAEAGEFKLDNFNC